MDLRNESGTTEGDAFFREFIFGETSSTTYANKNSHTNESYWSGFVLRFLHAPLLHRFRRRVLST